MKKTTVILASFVILSLAPVLALASTANAATCNGVTTSVDFNCDKYTTDGISAIIMYIINFMAIGVGIAVVIGILLGGITYAQSDGEESKAKEGREMISNSIIGLFLFIFLYAGANFLIPGGAFNLNGKVASTSSSSSSSSGSSSGTDNSKASSAAKLDKVYNFRDAAASSDVLKAGVLYRSALLADASSADKTELASLLKGGSVIDLRTDSDIKTDGNDPALTGVSHRNISIEGTTDYTKFVNNNTSRAAFGLAISTIALSDGPVLVHCTYGKDRTGWTVAMIMYALGATDKQVEAEYLKSNDNLPKGKSVKASYLSGGLSAIKKKYGTVDNYLKKGLGLSTYTLGKLKEKLGA